MGWGSRPAEYYRSTLANATNSIFECHLNESSQQRSPDQILPGTGRTHHTSRGIARSLENFIRACHARNTPEMSIRISGCNADIFRRRATCRGNTIIFILCQYNRSQSAPRASNERLLLRKSRKCRKKKACSENTPHQQYTSHGGTMGPDSSTTKNRCDLRTGSIQRL